MSTPRISLLIPCHNAARFLPRLFECIRRQLVPFHEILCYDDNSSDATREVARSLGATVIGPDGPSTGPAKARNRLAAAATGDWIHFHDADDLIDDTFTAAFQPECREPVGCVFCDSDWVMEDTRELILRWRYDQAQLAADPLNYLIGHPLGVNTCIILREAFRAIGGFNEALLMWEDSDCFIRLAAHGVIFRHIPQMLTISLRNTGTFSHDYRTSWGHRLKALEGYAVSLPASARPSVARAAETAADNLYNLGDIAGAKRALRLCRSLGLNAPTTHHPLLRLLKLVLPPITILRIQARQRKSRPGRQSRAAES